MNPSGLNPEIALEISRQMPLHLERLMRLCRQPSVAAQNLGIQETVQLVASLVQEAGGESRTFTLPGANPLILAEFDGVGGRTLLFYDHYDVQPAEPLDEWHSPPWEPQVRDGKLYGRGASDNKGDLISRLAAIQVLQSVYKELPCKIKFMIEGEEEVGSVHLPAYMAQYADAFQADACIWEFGSRDEEERLLFYMGLKGIAYFQLHLRVAEHDLHSSYGAIVDAASNRITRALAHIRDGSGRILIPGFYDQVRPPSQRELDDLGGVPFDEDGFKTQYGVCNLVGGVTGREALERLLYEPSSTVCGVWAGYTGAGTKTVLPKEAWAKLEFRLVPDQDPEDIHRKLSAHLAALGFDDMEVTFLGGEPAHRTDIRHPFVQIARQAAEEATGRRVVLSPTSAGSGPMHPVGHALNVPMVSLGTGYWGSLAHAPNENIRLRDFEETIRMIAHIIDRFARMPHPDR